MQRVLPTNRMTPPVTTATTEAGSSLLGKIWSLPKNLLVDLPRWAFTKHAYITTGALAILAISAVYYKYTGGAAGRKPDAVKTPVQLAQEQLDAVAKAQADAKTRFDALQTEIPTAEQNLAALPDKRQQVENAKGDATQHKARLEQTDVPADVNVAKARTDQIAAAAQKIAEADAELTKLGTENDLQLKVLDLKIEQAALNKQLFVLNQQRTTTLKALKALEEAQKAETAKV